MKPFLNDFSFLTKRVYVIAFLTLFATVFLSTGCSKKDDSKKPAATDTEAKAKAKKAAKAKLKAELAKKKETRGTNDFKHLGSHFTKKQKKKKKKKEEPMLSESGITFTGGGGEKPADLVNQYDKKHPIWQGDPTNPFGKDINFGPGSNDPATKGAKIVQFSDFVNDPFLEEFRRRIRSWSTTPKVLKSNQNLAASIDQVFVKADDFSREVYVSMLIRNGVDAQGTPQLHPLVFTGTLDTNSIAKLTQVTPQSLIAVDRETSAVYFQATLTCLDRKGTCENVEIKLEQFKDGIINKTSCKNCIACKLAYIVHRFGDARLQDDGFDSRTKIDNIENLYHAQWALMYRNTVDAFECKHKQNMSRCPGPLQIPVNNRMSEIKVRSWSVAYGLSKFNLYISIYQHGKPDQFMGISGELAKKTHEDRQHIIVQSGDMIRPYSYASNDNLMEGVLDLSRINNRTYHFGAGFKKVRLAQLKGDGTIFLTLDFREDPKGTMPASSIELQIASLLNIADLPLVIGPIE